MRLLRYNNGEFILEDMTGRDIPAYAILSHTWGPDSEEVSYKDVLKGRGKAKKGYNKLLFCQEQAANNDLAYFWVDTCCIDKSSSQELSEAINRMFEWYQKASTCYVRLDDVSGEDLSENDRSFRNSRWFTRGWTLQELLAPKDVRFFSKEGYLLGDKIELALKIGDITGIPVDALKGQDLSTFSKEERFGWAKDRQTKREEDLVYSLLGIFDVNMPLIYGEGKRSAFNRLEKELPKPRSKLLAPISIFSFMSFFLVSLAMMMSIYYPRLAWKIRHPFYDVKSDVLDSSSQPWNHPRPWFVPFPRPFFFTGRMTQTSELESYISRNESTRLAIYGAGGSGKTALALEVAYRMREKQPELAVFWVSASTPKAFEAGYRHISDLLRMSKHVDQETVNLLVKTKLSSPSSGRWLMIVDFVDDDVVWLQPAHNCDPQLLEILPSSAQGSVIFITNSQANALVLTDSTMALDRLQRAEAQTLLQSHLLPGHHYDPTKLDLIEQFLATLELCPLAIVQATAFIKANNISISEYMVNYQRNETEAIDLLSKEPNTRDGPQVANKPVLTTWYTSFSYIQQHNALAAEYLIFTALINMDKMMPIFLPFGACSLEEQEEAITLLKTFSFFTERTVNDGSLVGWKQESCVKEYDIHPLVRLAIKGWVVGTGQWQHWDTKVKTHIDELRTIWFSRRPWEQ